ncbi:NADP-dependent oxidoreductase domain-containing protein [Hygrophoropsis aurantiaca]|uniref:NADP-dependent oxidoreductase domain-containing protein n=1 Tax=Hygrophoropsis aurantiaca TaxID=72124 RepID=A0ACB8A605_9AGAM|nr:NADP-dependent oxidoreductase domain-containing protein [Hygrophoropsis aurantiaca]
MVPPNIPSFALNTGASIPAVGLGCFVGAGDEKRKQVKNWALTALKNGYRHLDTAWIYGTEIAVGEAIRESGIPREEIFVTTKLPWHHPGYVLESVEDSLRNAQLDYFDLYLIHFPQAVAYPEGRGRPQNAEDHNVQALDSPTLNETWADMEKVLASGKAKAIGVSNFSIKTLEQLFTTAKIVPAVLQVELHPYLTQDKLLAYCKEKGILVTAYTPTGYAKVRGDPVIGTLATKYGVTPAQIILAWHVSRGCAVTPKSENEGRQLENITLPTLSEEDIRTITSLDRDERLCNYPNENGLVYGWTMEQFGWS